MQQQQGAYQASCSQHPEHCARFGWVVQPTGALAIRQPQGREQDREHLGEFGRLQGESTRQSQPGPGAVDRRPQGGQHCQQSQDAGPIARCGQHDQRRAFEPVDDPRRDHPQHHEQGLPGGEVAARIAVGHQAGPGRGVDHRDPDHTQRHRAGQEPVVEPPDGDSRTRGHECGHGAAIPNICS